jgi:hypothetical protein
LRTGPKTASFEILAKVESCLFFSWRLNSTEGRLFRVYPVSTMRIADGKRLGWLYGIILKRVM